MHIVIIFHNIGGYHAARLRAAHSVCQQSGWKLTTIQVTDQTREHPWGNLEREISFPLETLLPAHKALNETDRRPDSAVAASYLSQCLAKLKPEILVIPGWGFPVSRTALQWARQHQVPAILMSESKWDDEKRTWWKEHLKSWLYVKKFDAALVGGKLHKDYLMRLGFAGDRIFLGYDAVDNEYFEKTAATARQNPEAARQRQSKIPSKPYFLAATRFISRKNVARLIEAFAGYRQQVGSAQAWDLVICGSGVEESAIRQQIYEHSLSDCVHLPGFITYQQIGDWYGLAQAFIHPALQEQWGLVVNEAMAAGLPVIVSNCCGCFEDLIIEGVNGFGFNPENQQQLTDLMLKVGSRQVDLKKMGFAALGHIQKFSPEYFAQGLRQAIEYALAH